MAPITSKLFDKSNNIIANFITLIKSLSCSELYANTSNIGPNIDDWDLNILSTWLGNFHLLVNDYKSIGAVDNPYLFNTLFKFIANAYVETHLITAPQCSKIISELDSIFNNAVNLRTTIFSYLDQLPYDDPSLHCQCALCLSSPNVLILQLVQGSTIGKVSIDEFKAIDPLLRSEPITTSSFSEALTSNTITITGKCVDILYANNQRLCDTFKNTKSLYDRLKNISENANIPIDLSRTCIALASSYLTWLTAQIGQHFPSVAN